jgi:hypothetical protein
MIPSTLRLTLRSRPALHGFVFVALALIFSAFAANDYSKGHRSFETTVWIAVLFLGTAGAFLAFARKRAIDRGVLLASGLPGTGIITAIRSVYGRHMRTAWYQELVYRYEPSPGQVHVGKSELLTTSEARSWEIGARGAIRFDAASPQRSVWIGTEDGQ